MSAAAHVPTTDVPNRFSVRRTLSLARWNAVLLTRNKLAFVYAVVMPLLPLLIMLSGERGDPAVGAGSITTVFLVIGLFPVYYNVLSQFVSRRDELVLKRMRTGEVRDDELIVSIALPGIISALVLAAVSVPLSQLFEQPLPVNPIVYAAAAILAVIMFTAFAFWTAAWTRSAEAAQLTSMPIIILASLGPLGASLADSNETLANLIERTPGAAMSELVRVGWFGFDGPKAETSTLNFADAFSAAGQPLLVMLVWTILACWFASRSMRWEPRS
jgi:ABC-2 type transport system permease protein